MLADLKNKTKLISITGLGYVGLPLALEFAKQFKVIGFDTDLDRVELIKRKIDPSRELQSTAFDKCDIEFTSNPSDLHKAHFHIITVPTDVDEHKNPDLGPLLKASINVGKILKRGDTVVFESTVYPGCTEEECLPLLEKTSSLRRAVDFKFGYSPERINPGDNERTLTKILKIVSGNDEEALNIIAEVYKTIIEAGIYKASSIKVAEAAKIIENTQRDINISFINELAIVFDKIGIDTSEVINAAATKWNFHKYSPGLVGGHCISVDPFYLMYKAKKVGYVPQLIAAGRNVNDYIPQFIAKRVVQTLIEKGKNPGNCRVLVMGITFKENVSDIRNSKVIDLIRELQAYSLVVDAVDPLAQNEEVQQAYGIPIIQTPDGKYDAIIIAVGHTEYKKLTKMELESISNDVLLLFDIKGIKNSRDFENYWKL